ncbi:MAG: hypothetical protein ACK5N8_06565 [Alphaproteobacteria bacterium]
MKKEIGYKILSSKEIEELVKKVKALGKKQADSLIYLPVGNVVVDESRVAHQTVVAYEDQSQELADYLIFKEHAIAPLEQNVCKKNRRRVANLRTCRI